MKHLPKEIIVNWKKESQFGGNVIYMSPDEYIDRVHIKNKLSAKEILEYENRAKKAGLKGILYYPPESKISQDYLKKAMLYGKALDIPWIEYDVQGKLRSQEGYNRALAAKKLGIKQIPVEIIKPSKATITEIRPQVIKLTNAGKIEEAQKLIDTLPAGFDKSILQAEFNAEIGKPTITKIKPPIGRHLDST